MDKYAFIREIGSGSFGKVFLVRSKHQGINYVIKRVDLTRLEKKESLSAKKEVELLSKLRHRNIVSYKESFEKNDQLNIVLEYCENGDLHEKIKEKRVKRKKFAESEVLDYFVQISLALEYIHSKKILHRDLKTKNIFLTKGNVIKLGDFGIAKVLENSFELAQTCIGSPFYVSPEICESKPYNKKSDVWALGCVLYEMATLTYAFVASNVKTLLAKILTGAYNPLPTDTDIHIRALISSMLKPNPGDRPSVRDILQKRFLLKRQAAFTYEAYKEGSEGLKRGTLRGCSEYKGKGISGPKEKYDPKKGSCKCGKVEEGRGSSWRVIERWEVRDGRGRRGCFVGKQTLDDDTDLSRGKNSKPDTEKMRKSANPFPMIEEEAEEFGEPCDGVKFEEVDDVDDEGDVGEVKVEVVESEGLEEEERGEGKMGGKAGQEQRKRWTKNTLQKEALLAILNNSELLTRSMTQTSVECMSGTKALNLSIDAILSCDPSEVTQDVLQPVRINEYQAEKENQRKNCLQLLQHEVSHLREKFELNNRNYQIEDLMRLTVNSRNILNLEAVQKYTEYDRKVGESVYHNLECLRMSLERKIGICKFLKVYGKMINIINNDLECSLKSSLDGQPDGTETYLIRKTGASGSGDGDDVVKNTWRSIIILLGDRQEYLSDVWELAMSENIYYHL